VSIRARQCRFVLLWRPAACKRGGGVNTATKFSTPLEENKIVMKRFVSSSSRLLPVLFAALFVMVPVTSTMASTVLSSNMANNNTNDFPFDNTQWQAAPFRTTSLLKTITGVEAYIFNRGQYNGGKMAIDIWTSKGNDEGPGSSVANIYEDEFTSVVNISGVSVALDSDTEYFVVARGVDFNDAPPLDPFFPPETGSLTWGSVHGDFDHTGNGFVGGIFSSSDSGATWIKFPYTDTLMMTVYASSSSSVPEIDPASFGSVAAFLTGAFGLIEQRRRRRGTATALTV